MDFLYFLKSTEKVSQDIIENISRLKWPKLREVLVSIIPYLNIKGEEQVTQPTQSAQGDLNAIAGKSEQGGKRVLLNVHEVHSTY